MVPLCHTGLKNVTGGKAIMSRWKQGWTRGSLFAALNIAAVVAVLMLGAGVAVADPDAAPGDPGGPDTPLGYKI